MTRSGRVATLEETKAQFQKSWDAWKAWANLEEPGVSHGTHNYSLWPVDFPNPNGLISWWRKPLDSTTSEPRFTAGLFLDRDPH